MLGYTWLIIAIVMQLLNKVAIGVFYGKQNHFR